MEVESLFLARCTGRKSGTSWKKPCENTGFLSRQTGSKLHSGLFLCTFLCWNTHVPPPPPPARHGPGPHFGPASHPCPALPARSGPLRPSGLVPATKFCPGSGHTGFFPLVRERGKNLVQKEKTHLLHRSDLALRAAPHRTSCPGILLGCSHNVA